MLQGEDYDVSIHDTEITHSEILNIDGKEQVKVYIETPTDNGFNDATCFLPDYKWEVHGYSDEEMKYFSVRKGYTISCYYELPEMCYPL